MKTSFGDMDIDIPRDRNGEFEPQLVKKHQTTLSGDIEEKIISMYAKGMTGNDISAHIEDIYGIDVSDSTISRITDKILPVAKEWQSRPLEEIYAVVFMDAIHYHVRYEGRIVKKAVYIALGINLDGTGTGLVFTSEYLLDKRTDLARTQALLVNEPINSERLSNMQENTDLLVSFYKYYASWIYQNYSSILTFCEDWAKHLKIQRIQADKPWQRADDHRAVAELSAELYIKYGLENAFISEKQAEYLRKKFSEILSDQRELELSLNAEISRRSGEKRIDVAKAILSIYNNSGFSDNPNDSFVRVTSNIECLYISPDILAFTINSTFKYNHDKKYYLKQLSRIGALITEPNRGNVKRFKGKDYAVIRLDILEDYSHSLNSLIDQYTA